MAFTVQIFLKNGDFSEEYAAEHHGGGDSPENIRYEWEDEFRINATVSQVELKRDQIYTLAGERGDDSAFSFDIPEVMIFEFHGQEGITPVVFSESSVDEYILENDQQKLTVFLNDVDDIENPIPGIYISVAQFPKELRR